MTLLSSASWSSTWMSELVHRENLYYKEGSDVPFTGRVIGRTEGMMKNGLMEGEWTIEHPFKIFSFAGSWSLRWKMNYKNGILHGPIEEYHRNGQLKISANYENEEFDGPYEEYYEDGQLKLKGTFLNRQFYGHEYDKNGKKKKVKN